MAGDFWENKKVIVTGGAGFLGSFVIEKLKQRGATDIFIPCVEHYNLVDPVDIRRMYADTLKDVDPKDVIVIHLAANVGGIGANREHPADFFYDNLMMGVELMHQAYKNGIGKFVAIGTVCAYPKFTPVPFREEDLWAGYPEETNAPYGLAKKMMLVQAQAYRQQHGFNAIFLLPVNLYGPRDNFNLQSSHVIPALIRKAVEAQLRGEKELPVWGDGSTHTRIPVCRRCRQWNCRGGRKIQRRSACQPRLRLRDLDQGFDRNDRQHDRLRRRTRLANGQAQRPTAPRTRCVPCQGILRLEREGPV